MLPSTGTWLSRRPAAPPAPIREASPSGVQVGKSSDGSGEDLRARAAQAFLVGSSNGKLGQVLATLSPPQAVADPEELRKKAQRALLDATFSGEFLSALAGITDPTAPVIEKAQKLREEQEKKDRLAEKLRQEAIAGGYRKGERVVAARNMIIHGVLVISKFTEGTVLGQSTKDSSKKTRIQVWFKRRVDGKKGAINVLPCEIKYPERSSFQKDDRLIFEDRDGHIELDPDEEGFVGVRFDDNHDAAPQSAYVHMSFLRKIFKKGDGVMVDDRGGRIECGPDRGGFYGITFADRLINKTDPQSAYVNIEFIEKAKVIAGGYKKGDRVVVARDMILHGVPIVVKLTEGTVLGQSTKDSSKNTRLLVRFDRREDGKKGAINVRPHVIEYLETSNLRTRAAQALLVGSSNGELGQVLATLSPPQAVADPEELRTKAQRALLDATFSGEFLSALRGIKGPTAPAIEKAVQEAARPDPGERRAQDFRMLPSTGTWFSRRPAAPPAHFR